MKLKQLLIISLFLQILSQKSFFSIFNNFKRKNSNKCVKYTCKDDEAYCAHATGKDLKVSLSPICNSKTEFCEIGDDPNIIFYSKKEVKAKCEKLKIKTNIIRYPGEDCNENSECSSNVCDNNICSGKKLHDKCNDTKECFVNLFCSKKTNRCEYQRDLYSSCDNSYECKNNLLCYNGLCEDVLFKFDVGTKINEESISPNYYCKYGISVDGICAKTKYLKQSLVENNFIKCNSNSDCQYRLFPEYLGITEKKCECGYNSEGDSYCPIDIHSNEIGWENYYKIMKLKISNDCHSYSRFKCYKNDIQFLQMLKEIEDELKMGHRYYNSVDCAKKVFNDINNI